MLDIPAPQVLVVELGADSVVLEIRFRVAPPSRREAVELTDLVLSAVRTVLDRTGIGEPCPGSGS